MGCGELVLVEWGVLSDEVVDLFFGEMVVLLWASGLGAWAGRCLCFGCGVGGGLVEPLGVAEPGAEVLLGVGDGVLFDLGLVGGGFPVVGHEAADLVLYAAVEVFLGVVHGGLSEGFYLGFALVGLAPRLDALHGLGQGVASAFLVFGFDAGGRV